MGSKISRLRNRRNSNLNLNNNLNLEEEEEEDVEEIVNQYYQIVNNHELLDTIKKSKKQQTFFLKKYHIIQLDNSDLLLQDECPICLERLKVNDSIYLIPCCHYFHKDCLRDWIMMENDCPSCRMKLGENTAEEIDMCLFTREDKVNKAKKRFILSLDKNKIKELMIKNNISNTDKNELISKLVNLNNLYSDEELIDSPISEESCSNNLSKESCSNNLSKESSTNNLSKESSTNNLSIESSTNNLIEEGLSEDSSSDNLTEESSWDSDKSIKIRYVRAG